MFLGEHKQDTLWCLAIVHISPRRDERSGLEGLVALHQATRKITRIHCRGKPGRDILSPAWVLLPWVPYSLLPACSSW